MRVLLSQFVCEVASYLPVSWGVRLVGLVGMPVAGVGGGLGYWIRFG